jgi:hypothetical protein
LKNVLLARHLRPNSRVNLIGISIALKAGMSGAPQKNPRTAIAARGAQDNKVHKRHCTIFLAIISAAICLSSGAFSEDQFTQSAWGNHRNTAYQQSDRVQSTANDFDGQFYDCTKEIVDRALARIDRNEREGAALDQHWYAFRRLGENLEQILKATEVRFYGGTEAEVLRAIASQYVSLDFDRSRSGPERNPLVCGTPCEQFRSRHNRPKWQRGSVKNGDSARLPV